VGVRGIRNLPLEAGRSAAASATPVLLDLTEARVCNVSLENTRQALGVQSVPIAL